MMDATDLHPAQLVTEYCTHWHPEHITHQQVLAHTALGYHPITCVATNSIQSPPEDEAPAPTPCRICRKRDKSTDDLSLQIGCDRCMRWFHLECLPPDIRPPNHSTLPVWTCPDCDPPSQANPVRYQMCDVTWPALWQGKRHIRSLPGGKAALHTYREHRQEHPHADPVAHPVPPPESRPAGPTPADALATLRREAHAAREADRDASILPPPTPPPALAATILSSRTTITQDSINPDRDASPTGKYCIHTVQAPNAQSPTLLRLCDPAGKAVSNLDLEVERYLFLKREYTLHATPLSRPFLTELAALLRRHDDRSKHHNPQGRPHKQKNQWAIPRTLMETLQRLCCTSTELFASPLNCSVAPNRTYFSAYPEDAVFGAIHNCMKYRWAGACQANPEYEDADMLHAMQRAIHSASATTSPFSCIMILPRWATTPYRHPSILQNEHVQLLTTVDKDRFKFVPAGTDITSPDALSTASAADWPVDLYVISNEAGYDAHIRPNLEGLQDELQQCLRTLSGFQDLHCPLNPAIPHVPDDDPAPPPTRKGSVQDLPPAPLPCSPFYAPPDTPPADHNFSPTWPLNPSITNLPRPRRRLRPLTVVEMCAGMGTGLEALLKAGHRISSYTWADINPDAGIAMRHRLELLHTRYPTAFPRSAFEGWDKRLPFNINFITPAILDHVFPDGIDFILAGPPCQPYSSAGKGKGFRDIRSLALLTVARIITHLHHRQPEGVAFIIENVPGTEKFPVIQQMLGKGVLLDAPACGSHAFRAAVFWQNMAPERTINMAYAALPRTPSTTLQHFLHQNGFSDWNPQYLRQGYNINHTDRTNSAGRPQRTLPKFVCFHDSRQFRWEHGRPALGLLHHNCSLEAPCADIRELAMGFTLGSTAAPGLTEQKRRHLLGQCIDLNLLTWLIATTMPPPCEGAQQPTLPPPASPISGVRSWFSLPFHKPSPPPHLRPGRPLPPMEGDLESMPPALGTPPPTPSEDGPHPVFTRRWDPLDFTYTDGSKKDGCTTLGAAVFHARSSTSYYIDATGEAETNTINRAELVSRMFRARSVTQ